MNDEYGSFIERLEFQVVARKVATPGLDDLQRKLNALVEGSEALNRSIAGLSQPIVFKKTAADIREMITQAERLGRFGIDKGGAKKPASLKPEDLAKALGYGSKELNNFLTQGLLGGKTNAQRELKAQLKELISIREKGLYEFRSPAAAAKGMAAFTKLYDPKQNPLEALRMAFSNPLPMPSPAAKTPNSNIQTPSPIQPPTGNRPSSKGKRKAAPADEGEEQSDSQKFREAMASIKRQLAENLIAETETTLKNGRSVKGKSTVDLEKQAAAKARAAAQVRGLVGSETGQKLEGKTTEDALAYAANLERASLDASQKFLRESGNRRFQLRKELDGTIRKGDKDREKEIRKEIKAEEKLAQEEKKRAADRRKSLERFNVAQEKTIAQATARNEKVAAFDAAQQAGLSRVQHVGQAWKSFLANGGTATHDEMRMGKGGMRRELRGEMQMPGGQIKVFSASIGEADAQLRSYARTVEKAGQKTGGLGSDMLTNTAKVAKWALSVGILYKTMGLAESSFEKFLTTSGQMARLDQIFRQVGGSTMELTSDILHLAAVTGRSGEEAMESAISWSRLGLTRIQVNEAVRLSLMAANVTQLSAAETTEHLQAISQNYGLTVGQLASKLGEMVRISNVYNVTNADMLQGVSRSAAMAKQAGMSFEELIGLIGGTVGATKQTGANIGNAIKTIITSLGSPQLQEKLRMLYGVQSEGPVGHAKPVTDVLDEIYVRYQKLDELQRRALTFNIGGKFQSQRLAAMLDNYVRSQVLAIDAQLHLNTAEQENLKIVDSLKAQLAGLSSEWERFVVTAGSSGPAQALGAIGTALRNVLSIYSGSMNKLNGINVWKTHIPLGSLISGGMMGIGAAALGKTVLTMMTTKAVAGAGIVGTTQQKALEAAVALNGFTNQAINGFAGRMRGFAAGAKLATDPVMGHVPWYMGGNNAVGRGVGNAAANTAVGYSGAVVGMNNFGNARMQAAARAFQDMRLAAAAANATIGATVKTLSLAGAALVEFAIPIAIVVGGIYLFNKAMDAMEGGAEASRKRLAGFNEELERSASAARAMGLAAKTMDTAMKAFGPMAGFGSMTPKNANRMLDQLGGAMFLTENNPAKRAAMQAKEVQRLKDLYKSGKTGEVMESLTGQRDSYLKAQTDRLNEELTSRVRQQEELSAQKARVEALQNKPQGMFDQIMGGPEGRRQQIIEIEKQQNDLSGDIVQSYQEIEAAGEEILSTDQRVTGELAKQKALLEAIQGVFSGISSSNPMTKWAIDVTAAQAKVMALGKALEQLQAESKTFSQEQAALTMKSDAAQADENMAGSQLGRLQQALAKAGNVLAKGDVPKPGSDLETILNSQFKVDFLQPGENYQQAQDRLKSRIDLDRKRQADLKVGYDSDNPGQVTETARNQKLQADNIQQMTEAKNQVAALQGQRRLMAAQMQMQMGREDSKRNAAGQSFGLNETQKALNVARFLAADIAALEAKGNLTIQEAGRLLENRNQQEEVGLRLLERKAAINAEIKQLQIEQNKEFQKSFFGAGPAEMLQKLAAFRMTFDANGRRRPAMSQGEFFSMSPEMRNNYGMLNPQFTPQMIGLKRESNQVNAAIGEIYGSINPEVISQKMTAMAGAVGEVTDRLLELLRGLTASATDDQGKPIPKKGFALGGYTGDGNPNEVAGVVHKGEVVIPANVVSGLGLGANAGSRGLSWAGWKAGESGLEALHAARGYENLFESATHPEEIARLAGQTSKWYGRSADLTSLGGAASRASMGLARVSRFAPPVAVAAMGLEAYHLGTNFNGVTGQVEAEAGKGYGHALWQGISRPLSTIATAGKLGYEQVTADDGGAHHRMNEMYRRLAEQRNRPAPEAPATSNEDRAKRMAEFDDMLKRISAERPPMKKPDPDDAGRTDWQDNNNRYFKSFKKKPGYQSNQHQTHRSAEAAEPRPGTSQAPGAGALPAVRTTPEVAAARDFHRSQANEKPEDSGCLAALNAATESLNALTGAAGRATQALLRLATQANNTKASTPVVPQMGGVGGSSGFTKH